jgi:hypothetical protein
MHARTSSRPECVATLKRLAVVVCPWNCEASADRVAGSKQGPKVRLKGDPERGNYKMAPAAMTASATVTQDLSGTRFAGAQRPGAAALSSFIDPRLPLAGLDAVAADPAYSRDDLDAAPDAVAVG